MNIVFMGTPDFSVPCLKSLLKSGHSVKAVFTQPDKPKNRGHKMMMPPVKEFALEKNLEIFQPLSFKKGDSAEEAVKILKDINPDCIVVVAYGQILPKVVLDIPKYGCINVHASLLPKYRGAAPIHWSIIDGEKETGVTTMFMEEGLDTGDMLLKESVVIEEDMTYSSLHDKLSEIGGRLIAKTLEKLENGYIIREKQDGEKSCYAKMISKEMCRIDFTKPSDKVYDFIRGLSSNPCAYTFLEEKRLKVYFAVKSEKSYPELNAGELVSENSLEVVCGDKKSVILTEIQLEGSNKMNVSDFLRGRKITKNSIN